MAGISLMIAQSLLSPCAKIAHIDLFFLSLPSLRSGSRSPVVTVFHQWHSFFHCDQCSWAARLIGEPRLGNQTIQEAIVLLAKIMWDTHTQTFHNGYERTMKKACSNITCNRRGRAGLYSKSLELEPTQTSILNKTDVEIEVYLHTMESHILMKMNKVQIEANLV